VKPTILPIALGVLCVSFTLAPSPKIVDSPAVVAGNAPVVKTISDNPDAATVYEAVNLEQFGLSEEAFNHAWKGYQYLIDRKKISRADYFTICDLSKSSLKKRLYIIDINNNKLVKHTYVAHGKNSGLEYATSFSNTPESLQTSLGFYITDQTYNGKHGLSLRLQGVDPGFNDKAMARTIVMHGAAYVSEDRAASGTYMGRSWGCPAVPEKESSEIITTIKNGTCLFIYHPSKNYLNNSKILTAPGS
jgi:hypothetical protein